MIIAFVGLGSNLEDPVDQIRRAASELDEMPESRLLDFSALYRSKPFDRSDQPDYINAAAKLATRLDALILLAELQKIEHCHERERERRWGPRTLDLDVLLYGEARIHTDQLDVPHPEIARRAFVIRPLMDIEPQLRIPGLGVVAELNRAFDEDAVERL